MPLFDVSVSRVCYHDHVYEIEAETEDEAYDKGLAEAEDDDCHTWCKHWEDIAVDGVHPK